MKDNLPEVLINPYTAIRLFARVFLSVGDSVLKDRRFKVTREAWIASMFLLAIKKHTDLDWYLSQELFDGSPDFNCYTFKRNEVMGGNDKPLLKLEVFEWRKEDSETDFLKALKKIKLDKIIDPEITLVCYIRRDASIPPVIKLNEEIIKMNPRVKDVWYLGSVSPDYKIWRVAQLFPNVLAIDIDYDEILSTREEHSFVYAYRGKSAGVENEATGKSIILTPEFEIKSGDEQS